jgi:16S rRNA processing protein RimM
MIDLSDYIVAGIITKTHGVHGQVIMQLNNLSFENILKMELVIIEIDGLPVPFFIESFSSRNATSIILSLEDIKQEKNAIELIDKKVYVKPETILQELIINNPIDKLIGYKIVDKKLGEIGILKEILEVHNNPLLRVLNGKKEILIPFQDEFIIKLDDKNRIINVKTPSGLTELFD